MRDGLHGSTGGIQATVGRVFHLRCKFRDILASNIPLCSRHQCERKVKSQPHILIANFERRVLRPLNFTYCAVALYYLWHRAWILGIAIFVLSLAVGAIGQGLPHRKHETLSELAGGSTFADGFAGELSLDDGGALSRACVYTILLLNVTASIILWHEGWRWYWILLALVVAWPLLLIAFMSLAAGPLDILRVWWRKRRTE
jgi:hypothetical protein